MTPIVNHLPMFKVVYIELVFNQEHCSKLIYKCGSGNFARNPSQRGHCYLKRTVRANVKKERGLQSGSPGCIAEPEPPGPVCFKTFCQ